jgi:hypothetical protein
VGVFVFLGLANTPAFAQNGGFSGGVTPSRFELNSDAGDVLRRSLQIYNLGSRPRQFRVRTVEWTYSEAGASQFHDALAANSCRPWVRLERHKIVVVPDPKRPRNFRFEIEVPEDAPAQECTFAIMIESIDQTYDASFADGALNLPVTGRIAVIVYVSVGDVTPDLQFGEIALHDGGRGQLPALQVRNVGGAHGRLDADLVAVNEDGDEVRLSLATSPILPGQTRYLAMSPEPGKALQYPLTVTGKVYADGKAVRINQILDAPET